MSNVTKLAIEPGCLVEWQDGAWGIVERNGDSMAGEPWFTAGGIDIGTASNPSMYATVLLPAPDKLTPEEALAALAELPGATAGAARLACYWHLETGRVWVVMLEESRNLHAEYHTYVGVHPNGKVTANTYDAHMRDMQRFGALRQWLSCLGSAL